MTFDRQCRALFTTALLYLAGKAKTYICI
ncbi:hypothetical protein MXB_2806, partial [Myxobolus squamalis]